MIESLLDAPRPAQGVPLSTDDPFASLVGQSVVHRAAVDACARLSQRGVRDVLLIGPPGSGKAHLARCMHNAGPRANEAFLTIDCGALSADALETDLFGSVPSSGSRTPFGREGLVQLAGAGTVFLRRVDLLPPEFQPRLHEVMRQRTAQPIGGHESFEVRCTFTASAGPALTEMADTGRFDRALYNHFIVTSETIPSLRDRLDDIPILASHFLGEAAREAGGVGYRTFSAEVLERLIKHKWPGNVRELRRAVRSAATASTSPEIQSSDLVLRREVTVRRSNAAQIHIPAGTGKTLSAIEAEAIEITLRQTAGNKSAAARILGISRPRLQRKLDKYELESSS